MTEQEWLTSDDVPAMLEALCTRWRGDQADIVRLTHRYLLACCRAVWRLLPLEASRRGVEVAERYIEGRATREEYGRAEYEAEGAAFFLNPYEHLPEDDEPTARETRLRYYADREARIGPLVKDVETIPPEVLGRMVRPASGDAADSPRQLLADTAYFADSAIAYPGIRPRESVIERHKRFLSAPILREVVGNLFHPEGSRLSASGEV